MKSSESVKYYDCKVIDGKISIAPCDEITEADVMIIATGQDDVKVIKGPMYSSKPGAITTFLNKVTKMFSKRK